MKSLNDYIHIYKEQLEKGDIQQAYMGLLKYTMELKAHFSKEFSDEFSVGNISPGYMDFTYFPFFNEYLRDNKLRFGIVLNHKKIRFELWLMGQNEVIKNKYWDILKKSKWNKDRTMIPRYSVLEVVLIENPNFSNLNFLTQQIEKQIRPITNEIIEFIKSTKK